ncbi:unnamed protein product [Bursaphelenchus xylophilus]|nr:unnamed protein product [Bursaphelenchus xylophilus]CAG9128134.1 unnamed protein product [Bursaphelenchus xylophilus]
MEALIFEPDEFAKVYNCNLYDTELHPREERRLRLVGLICLLIGIVSVVLYLACIYAMTKKELIRLPAFKLMIYMAFFHMHGCLSAGFFMAFMFYDGTVFCEHPTIDFIGGELGTAFWIGSMVTSTILSFNRCCAMYDQTLAYFFFSGNRVYLWMILPGVLCYYGFLFEPPVLYSGIGKSWYFNPHYHYIDEVKYEYVNQLHTFNNIFTVSVQVVLTITFAVLYFDRVKSRKSQMTRNDKLMCLQVFLIGLFEMCAGTSFLVQQHVELDFAMSLFASFSWFGSQAIAPYIYLTFNRTVRTIVVRKFLPCWGRKNNVNEMPSTTHEP